MTYAPASLRSVQALWTGQGGVNLGIVGDLAHQARGVSYHLGRDQLTSTAYSRRTARDIAGLTRAASAIDLGRLDGSLVGLRNFSTWLVGQGRSNAPGTADIREIIYSPDGKTVLRWDRERGHTSLPRKGEADSSHLTHTHISWYRDSEYRDRTVAIRPFFGLPSLPDTSTEVPVSIAFEPVDEPVRAGIFRARRTGDTIVTYPLDSDPRRGSMALGAVRHGMGRYTLTGIPGGRVVILVWEDGEFAFVAEADGTWSPKLVDEDATYNQAIAAAEAAVGALRR